MANKIYGQEVPFVETMDEAVKSMIERAFLKKGVSYLIKVDKVIDRKKGLFEKSKKYSFYISRFQEDQAKSAMAESEFEEDSVVFLIQ